MRTASASEPHEPPPPPRRATAAAALRGAGAALVGAILLASFAWMASVAGGDVPDLRAALRRSRPLPAALATLLLAVSIALMGMRWRALMPVGPVGRPGAFPVFLVLTAGQLLAHLVPGPVAELSQAVFLGRRHRLPASGLLAAAVQGRIIGLVTAAAVGAAMVPLIHPEARAAHGGLIAAFTVGNLAVAAVLVGLTLRPGPWSRALRRVLRACGQALGRRGWPGARLLHRAEGAVGPFVAGLGGAPGGWRGRAEACLWALACHGAVIAAIAANCAALGATPDLAGVAFGYGAVTAAAVAVFLIPSFELGWDAMNAALLSAAGGVPLPLALVAIALMRLQRFAVLALGALLLAIRTGAGLGVARGEEAEGAGAPPAQAMRSPGQRS